MRSKKRRTLKLALYTLVAMMTAGAANAFIVINFNSVGGYVHFGGDPVVADLIDSGLVQVLWSADSEIGLLNQGNADPTGGDIVLGSRSGVYSWNLTEFGQITSADGAGAEFDTPASMTDGDFLAGNVYLRVFDSPNPTLGDHYVSGSRIGVSQVWTGLTGDSGGVVNPNDEEELDITNSPDAVQGEFGADYVALDMTIVPEPGTFALFGIGLATLVARRRRK